MADFMKHKRSPADTADLVEQLRFGWDVAMEFALKRHLLYALFAQHVVVNPDLAAEGYALMKSRVQRLVDTGRFNQPVDVAARAVWAASQGLLSLAAQHVAQGCRNDQQTSLRCRGQRALAGSRLEAACERW